MKYSLCILIILSTAIVSFGVELNVVHEWKYCEYEWKNQQQKENAINSKSYDPYLCFFFDAIKADDGRVFISTPKYFDHGVPASLATVTNATGPGGPLLRPYPDWSWHNNTSCMCYGIVNVHRIYIKCNHIFVLDSGEVGVKQICNPKLLIFDLKDDTLVKTIYIPLDMATDEKDGRLFITITNVYGLGSPATLTTVTNKISSGGPILRPYPDWNWHNSSCDGIINVYRIDVFMTDAGDSGLVVYNSFTNSMCRVESDYMKPNDTSFSIAGENFTYVGGIGSITVLDDDGRLFITITNVYGPGSPVTLTTVINKIGLGGPILRPYPNWSWYNNKSICDSIVNVYRADIQCNHIIILDNGKIGQFDQVCNPKLLIFDLKDDTLVETIYLPLDFATNRTGFGLLATPLVYSFLIAVFITDTKGSGLVMYDSSAKRMCRIESDYMKPTDTFFSVANQNFTYEGGIFNLYYVPISGRAIYKIKIKTLLECPNKKETNKQSKLVTKLSSQTAVITSSENSIFYSDYKAMSILGMNILNKSSKNAVELAQDDEKFQVISSMKISSYWNKMTCISNRFQHFALNTLNLSDTNFHYFEIKVSEIKKKMN
ncbi:MRJP1 protein, partial [Pseudoatta argentina]